MVLVVISAIIVATYIGLQLAIRAPEIQQPEPVSPPASDSQTGQPAAPPEEDPTALVRKDGVYTFALLGKDVKGSNTDTIILARYDTVAQTVGMVSIPRATAVHRTWSKYSKFNAAFYGSSPETLKEDPVETSSCRLRLTSRGIFPNRNSAESSSRTAESGIPACW